MKVKTFQTEYKLIEFCYYIDAIDGTPINVVDMIVDYDDCEELEKELKNLIRNRHKHTYIFWVYSF